MILTFELEKDGKTLNICFDEEGRDRLIREIEVCIKPGDHSHLMPDDPCGGYVTTKIRFFKDSVNITWVDVGIPGLTLKPIKND